jgi:rhamnulokinase
MAGKVFLAVDLGASSGRVVAGLLADGRLELDVLHRFENGPVRVGNRQHWDLLGQWREILQGLRAAAAKYPGQVVSVGVDTWGVDYGLLGPGDELLGNPYAYRDARTEGIFDRAFQLVPRADIFAETGLQFMELNTLYQLLAAKLAKSPVLDVAKSMLLMPDLFHWLLTGEKSNEQTNASTTQLYNPQLKKWSTKLIDRFDFPPHIFGPITQPGTRLGPLLDHVVTETGLAGASVVLPGTHDTASAVYAVPANANTGAAAPDWCYLSSGTWSLMGIESPAPVINDDVARWNFTNEAGVGGTTRLLKNISGLWLVQECRRIWQRDGKDLDWDELTAQATKSAPLVSLIDVDDARLVAPENMPATVAELCRERGQSIPVTPGATIRCCLESLALKYRGVHRHLEQLVGGRIETIHIVGGGSQNHLLNQMTASACGRTVAAGPVEATAIGNVMVQAQTAGEVGSHAEARALIRRSFPVETFEPDAAEGKKWGAIEG